ncbi:MAG: glutamate--tRNA ligase [Anaerolineae bacterium]|nr:glutamate--tRNA ligase [Anaerolineae bacterium]
MVTVKGESDLSETSAHPVRVRFAPSPTGYLHIGGARTALFTWLFAQKHNGTFILRIEDTDQKRYVPDAEEDIKQSLQWLGIRWQEGPDVGGDYGPYRQSERTDLYLEWSDWLIEHGYAYRCNCSAERLNEVREEQRKKGEQPGYDHHCRDLGLGANIGPHVVRFKMPLDGETPVEDLIRGTITFQNSELQDLVLMKSDGLPTYHLANVIDDHFMAISHITRADEWIATAPLHVQIYRAFGWEMPAIAHLPVILSPSGKGKLSKRDQAFTEGDTQVLVQVREFREAGYLPEAVVNFLTNVGWAFGDDREVFSTEEVLPRFRLEDINPAPGRLPYEKLEWLNGVYIREKLSVDELAAYLKPILEDAGLTVDDDVLRQTVPLIKERLKTLNEVVEWIGFLFRDDVHLEDPQQLIQKKMDKDGTLKALKAAYDLYAGLDDFSHESQEQAMRALADEMGLKAGQLFGTIREAITAQRVSPPLFETNEILGKDACLKRIKAAIALLES